MCFQFTNLLRKFFCSVFSDFFGRVFVRTHGIKTGTELFKAEKVTKLLLLIIRWKPFWILTTIKSKLLGQFQTPASDEVFNLLHFPAPRKKSKKGTRFKPNVKWVYGIRSILWRTLTPESHQRFRNTLLFKITKLKRDCWHSQH